MLPKTYTEKKLQNKEEKNRLFFSLHKINKNKQNKKRKEKEKENIGRENG